MKGTHSQVSSRIRVGRANFALLIQGIVGPPRCWMMSLIGPMDSLNSIRPTYPTAAGVSIIGIKKTTRKNRRKRISWLSSSANPRPKTYCSPTAPTTKNNVTRAVFQKRVSDKRVAKLFNPTKRTPPSSRLRSQLMNARNSENRSGKTDNARISKTVGRRNTRLAVRSLAEVVSMTIREMAAVWRSGLLAFCI